MVIDYEKPPRTISLTSIESLPIEIVLQHKFHDTLFDNRLTFELEVDADCTMRTAVDLLSMEDLITTEFMKMF